MTSNMPGAPPGKQNGRPIPRNGRPTAHNNAATASNDSVQATHDETAFRDGYGLGYGTGWHVGYRFAYHEQAEVERLRMARMHDIFTTPAYAELERIRWDGRREDFGKPRPGDFPGMGADYRPAEYYTPLYPGGASPHRRERGAA